MRREIVPRRVGEVVWALATRQHGVVSLVQLLAAGLTRDEVRRRREAGGLRPLHRGVYAVGHGALTQRGRWMAAVLACGDGAVLSHRPAAALMGLVASDHGRPHVSVPRGGGRSRPGIAVHRVAWIAADAVDEIPCTTVARTLVDLAGCSRRRALERALDEADRLQRLDMAAIRDALLHIARPRGARLLRALLAAHEPAAATRSELEDRLLDGLRAAGLPRPVVNGRVEALEVDFHWPARRLVVETDGEAFHRGERSRARDRARDRVLQLAGWRVLRFGWAEVVDGTALLVLRGALAE